MTGSAMVPVEVRADLASGIGSGHAWGLGLDGLLAGQLWADLVEHTAPDQVPWPSSTAIPPDLDLPLARCTLAGDELWHWAATCAHIADGVPHVRYRYQPTPGALFETWAGDDLPGTINPGTRYGRREVPELVTTCTAVTWRAVGDPARIRSLLEPITAIGKGRHRGDGQVLFWTITPAPDADPWAFAHLHPDATLGRPAPAACLPHELAAIHPPMRAGLRPPAMHPARQHALCCPAA